MVAENQVHPLAFVELLQLRAGVDDAWEVGRMRIEKAEIPGDGRVARVADDDKRTLVASRGDDLAKPLVGGVDRRVDAARHDRVLEKPAGGILAGNDAMRIG